MSERKMPMGRRFQPGVSGNPKGKPPLPKEIREAKRLNRMELELIMNELMGMSSAELRARMDDPKATALELLIGSVIAKGINKGDQQRLNFLLDRLVGRVATKVQLSGEDGGPIRFAQMTPQEKIKEITEANKVLQELGDAAPDTIEVTD